MCKERRSTIQVIDMGGKTPKQVVSVNLTVAGFYLSLIMLTLTVAGSLYAGVTKLGRMQAETVLKPVVEQCVREEVRRQITEALVASDQRLTEIKVSIEALNAEAKTLGSEISRNTKMLEILLKDRLHVRERGESP